MVPPVAPDDTPVVVVEPPAVSSERSPSDLLRLVVATAVLLLLLLIETLFGDALVAFMTALLGGSRSIPSWLYDTVISGSRVFAVVFLGCGLLLTILRER